MWRLSNRTARHVSRGTYAVHDPPLALCEIPFRRPMSDLSPAYRRDERIRFSLGLPRPGSQVASRTMSGDLLNVLIPLCSLMTR